MAERMQNTSRSGENGIFSSFFQHSEFSGQKSVQSELVLPRVSAPIYENEFWTAGQRGSHSLHEISYRACFKAELPAFFLQALLPRNHRATVYDPFMGRGTTLLEAALGGHSVIGNDVNPLSAVLIAPRLETLDLAGVENRVASVPLAYAGGIDPELGVFFEVNTLREIYGLRTYFLRRMREGSFDGIDAWIRMVVVNRLTGHSSGFFSVYTLPPNQATSVTAQRRINANRNQVPTYRNTRAIILKKSRSLCRDGFPGRKNASSPLLLSRSADDTPEIPSASVDIVITSPPFLDVVNYVQDNWMRNWFCGIEFNSGQLWMLRRVEDWTAAMTRTFRELNRVLKPGGWVVFEVGEVNKGSIPLEEKAAEAATAGGLEVQAIVINRQNFTKTANCWGVDNNSKGTNSNRMVIARKS